MMHRMLKIISIILVLTIMTPTFFIQVRAISEDELNVRMTYLKKIEQGETNSLLLQVSVINQRHSIIINWTGIHFDWQAEDEFSENTTHFELNISQSVMIGLSVHCPRGTSLGMHSDYISIDYLSQDGANGTWTSHMWMSEETTDFEVLAAPANPSSSPFALFTSSVLSNLCFVITAVLVVMALLAIIVSSRKKKAKYAPSAQFPIQYGGSQYGTQYYPSQPPVPQYPAGERSVQLPDTTPRTCPYCGSMTIGAFCDHCGHLIGE